MFTELLLAVVSIFFIVNKILNYRRIRKELPPGPFPWPIIGNFLLLRHLSRKHRGQHLAFLELSRQYSSNIVSLRVGSSDLIAVSGYNEIQQVLAGEEYDGRPWNEFIKLRNMGLRKGITMADGPEWKIVRAWLEKSLRQIGFGRTTDHIEHELRVILDKIKDGGVFRMKSIIAPAAYNVIFGLVTGKRISEDDKSENKELMNLMDQRSDGFDMAGGILSVFPWIRHIAPEASGYKLLSTLNDRLKSVLMAVIQEHKKTYITNEDRVDLIDKFLKEMDDRKGTDSIFDIDQLFMILLDIFIAGTAITQVTIDFLFLRMAVHQDIQQRVHEELDSVITSDRLPEMSDRAKLPYTHAVLTESQRLHSVMPLIGPRRVTSETSINSYRIPKESSILINVWSVHMNPEFFPEPRSFRPDRFFKDGAYVSHDKLIPFGRGHRRCPGEPEAKATVFLFFAGIMQNFQVLPAPGQGIPDVEPKLGIMNVPKPYKVLLVPRQRKNITE